MPCNCGQYRTFKNQRPEITVTVQVAVPKPIRSFRKLSRSFPKPVLHVEIKYLLQLLPDTFLKSAFRLQHLKFCKYILLTGNLTSVTYDVL